MKVFKFGGASIKNTAAIRNMSSIIKNYYNGLNNSHLIVVVSAMGKTTNALEKIWLESLDGNQSAKASINHLIDEHIQIAHELIKNSQKISDEIYNYKELLNNVCQNKPLDKSIHYDSIVSIGELLSSTIIASFLNEQGIDTQWTDARQLIRTDDSHREAIVDWSTTKGLIEDYVKKVSTNTIIFTQGFIGGTAKGVSTTLGREGSDFTGAIFTHCLDAESLTVWKDVPGILNADPKRIKDVVLFDELSYKEASEMTYYGASVIHPKTIKPLANKAIPLYVRCFDRPALKGTTICKTVKKHNTPVIIFKKNQCLVSFKSKDLNFVNEKGISVIFDVLHELNIGVHIMQNAAVSFSICIDYHPEKIEQLIEKLSIQYKIYYNTDLELITIKNYNKKLLDEHVPKNQPLMEQKSRNKYRVLVRKK